MGCGEREMVGYGGEGQAKCGHYVRGNGMRLLNGIVGACYADA